MTLTGANSGRPSPMNCRFAVFCAVSRSGARNPVYAEYIGTPLILPRSFVKTRNFTRTPPIKCQFQPIPRPPEALYSKVTRNYQTGPKNRSQRPYRAGLSRNPSKESTTGRFQGSRASRRPSRRTRRDRLSLQTARSRRTPPVCRRRTHPASARGRCSGLLAARVPLPPSPGRKDRNAPRVYPRCTVPRPQVPRIIVSAGGPRARAFHPLNC